MGPNDSNKENNNKNNSNTNGMLLSLKILRGVDLIPKDKSHIFSSTSTSSNPYCLIYILNDNSDNDNDNEKTILSRTEVRFKTLYPIWGGLMSTSKFYGSFDTCIKIEIRNHDNLSVQDECMGQVCFTVRELLLEKEDDYPNVWRSVTPDDDGCECSGQLELRLQCVGEENEDESGSSQNGTDGLIGVGSGGETAVEVSPSLTNFAAMSSNINTSVRVTTTPTKSQPPKKEQTPTIFTTPKRTRTYNSYSTILSTPKLSPGPNLRTHARRKIKNLALSATAPVFLHVYDVFNTTTTRRLNTIGHTTGLGGIFHGGIEVYGKEYSFGGSLANRTGIFHLKPRKCPIYSYRKSIYLGDCELSPKQVSTIIEKMKPEWMAPTYDFLRKNCCFFSKEFAIELGVGTIPKWVYSLAYVGAGLDDMRKKNNKSQNDSSDGGIPQYFSSSDEEEEEENRDDVEEEDVLPAEMGMEMGLEKHNMLTHHHRPQPKQHSATATAQRKYPQEDTNNDVLLPEEMGMEMAYSETDDAVFTARIQSVRRIQSFYRCSKCAVSRSMDEDSAIGDEMGEEVRLNSPRRHRQTQQQQQVQQQQQHFFPEDEILPDEMGTELGIKNGDLDSMIIITGNPTASAAFRATLLRSRSRSNDLNNTKSLSSTSQEGEKQQEEEKQESNCFPGDEELPTEIGMELFMDGVLDSIMAVRVQSAFRGSLARRQQSSGILRSSSLSSSSSSSSSYKRNVGSSTNGKNCSGILLNTSFKDEFGGSSGGARLGLGNSRLAKQISAIMEEDELEYIHRPSFENEIASDPLVDVQHESGKVEIELLH